MRTLLSYFLVFYASQSFSQQYKLEKQYVFYEASKFDYDTVHGYYMSYKISCGRMNVFEFVSNNSGDPGNGSIAISKVVFQLDSLNTVFDSRDSDLIELGTIYMQMCTCQDEGVLAITKGRIRGEEMENGNWVIDIDIEFPGRFTQKLYHIKESAEFTPAVIEY